MGYYDIQFLFSKHIALPIPCEGKCSHMSCLDEWNIRGSEMCQLQVEALRLCVICHVCPVMVIIKACVKIEPLSAPSQGLHYN